MRYNVDIVSGFFESGKTTFIKNMIEKEALFLYDRILVFNCEKGIEDYIGIETEEGQEIKVVDIFSKEDFCTSYIKDEIEAFNPDYVVVEYNGMWEIGDVLKIDFGRGSILKNIIAVADYGTFDLYVSNMGNVMLDKISNSDIVVFTKNKVHDVDDMNKKFIFIKKVNPGCDIYYDYELFQGDEADILGKSVSNSDRKIIEFGSFFVILNLAMILMKKFFPDFFSGRFQKIMVVFVSLMIEILPFLLIGAVISSLIMVVFPREKLDRIFAKGGIMSIFAALFAGVAFPVCDCAMVPIASSIVKKGYSVPVAVTFLLSSPAVNPIVIFSTFFAFNGDWKMVLYRMGFGLIIAFAAGLIMEFYFRTGDRKVVKEHIESYGNVDTAMTELHFRGRMRYVEAMVVHTKQELFKVGVYVVFGAFISSVIQVMVPRNIFISVSNINSISVLVMILAAFFISVCSTSNAFIARSFYPVMPQNAILAFLVMGPMVDITNITVLTGTFKKKYIAVLVGLLVYMSFMIFSLIPVFKGVF